MVALWICLCAFLNCAGWTLSALHSLNRIGYLLSLVLFVVVMWVGRQNRFVFSWPKMRMTRWRWRCRQFFPLIYLVLGGLAFVGGVLYAPANYDGLAYRIPRTLHWLAEGQWHWIHTEFARLNNRATGFEWLSAPLIAFTGTDRFIFLLNSLTFFLLPGLFFSVLTRLGVRKRVAATWMWLLPTGYCYLLQAGSIGNDLIGSFYVLAAIHFALRAWQLNGSADFWLSLLAAGLVSSGKTSNLPALLPWCVAIAPAFRWAIRSPAVTVGVCLVAAMASFLPMAVLNAKYAGDWTGLAAEHLELTKGEPTVRVANNAMLLTIQNFVPPVFPMASTWNHKVDEVIPRAFAARVQADFEPAGAHWQMGEMQMEETAGLGFGLCVLLAVSLLAMIFKRQHWWLVRLTRWRVLLCAASGAAMMAFMLKSNLATAARLISPYYGFLIPWLLLPRGHEWLVRARWWRWVAGLLMVPALLLLVVSPPRPLWPAQAIMTKFAAREQVHPLVRRAYEVYAVYGLRNDGFKPVRAKLPPDLKVLGFLAADEIETSLWRPFGRLRVMHIKVSDSAAELRRRGIEYVLVSDELWALRTTQGLASWCGEQGLEMVEHFDLRLRARRAAASWHLLRLRSEGSVPAAGEKP